MKLTKVEVIAAIMILICIITGYESYINNSSAVTAVSICILFISLGMLIAEAIHSLEKSWKFWRAERLLKKRMYHVPLQE